MSKKTIFSMVVGAAAVVGVACLTAYVANEIEKSTDEDISYRQKAERYFTKKWKDFKSTVDEKNKQIEKIIQKVKEDVVKEVDEIRRKEIVETASRQIAALRDEIKNLAEARRRDLVRITSKIKDSDIMTDTVRFVTSAGSAIKKSIAKKLSENEVYEVDFPVGSDIFDDELS